MDSSYCVRQDHYENIYLVLAGEKHFTLLPPTDYPFLYERLYPPARFKQDPKSGKWHAVDEPNAADNKVPWISVDPDTPDLQQFPLFAKCTPLRVTLKAGECLYLPSLWYHQVRVDGPASALGLTSPLQVTQTADSEGKCIAINYWYDMKYDAKYNYRNFLVRNMMRRLLSSDYFKKRSTCGRSTARSKQPLI
jgi:jumonji domain-containing protein 7